MPLVQLARRGPASVSEARRGSCVDGRPARMGQGERLLERRDWHGAQQPGDAGSETQLRYRDHRDLHKGEYSQGPDGEAALTQDRDSDLRSGVLPQASTSLALSLLMSGCTMSRPEADLTPPMEPG